MPVQTFIDEYLEQVRFMQLATATPEGKPWCCTVHFAYDKQYNLYWISKPDRRHSLEIARNKHAAGVILLPREQERPVRGIQFEGTARQLTDASEIRTLFQPYAERFKTDALMGEALVSGASPSRLYQLRTTAFVLYDELNFPEEPRQEWIPPAMTA